MRTLTGTLTAAQKARSGVPYLPVEVSDRSANVARLRWERLYTGSEPDTYHASAMAGDGSLLRARVAADNHLYYSRVTSPGSGSTYSTWTDMGATLTGPKDCALATNGANVLLVYFDTAGQLVVRQSTDNGASFAAAVVAAGATASPEWLAVALESTGDAVILYTEAAVVRVRRRLSGAWSAGTAWPTVLSSAEGVALIHAGDYHAVICGIDSAATQSHVYTAIYGDGFSQPANTWSASFELARADPNSNVGHTAPFIFRPDTHRLSFIEVFLGSVAYNRPYLTHLSPSQVYSANAWREPLPFDLPSSFGLALAGADATHAWATTPAGVWRANHLAPSADLTPHVLRAQVALRPRAGTARVTLRNDDGRFNALPNATYPIRPGAQLELSPGYHTTAGDEASLGPLYWVTRIHHVSEGGVAQVILDAGDAWSAVRSWRARRQYTFAAGTTSVFNIIRFVFGRAGIELVGLGSSSASVNQKPDFTIPPGQDGVTAIDRALATIPDVIFTSGEFAYIFEPLASASSAYNYGSAGSHPVYTGHYIDPGHAFTRSQAFGPSQFDEAFDWAAIANQDDAIALAADHNLTSAALVSDRADFTLRQAALADARGQLVSPPHCGQEIHDVIDITDPRAGLASTKYRVIGLDLDLDRSARKAKYEQRLLLGNP